MMSSQLKSGTTEGFLYLQILDVLSPNHDLRKSSVPHGEKVVSLLSSASSVFVRSGLSSWLYTHSNSSFQSQWKRYINCTMSHHTMSLYTQEHRPSFELMKFWNLARKKFRRQLFYKSEHTIGIALIFGQLNKLNKNLAVILLPHIHTQLIDQNMTEENWI